MESYNLQHFYTIGVETWPSYTDQCNTEDSSEHSSCHSDSDESFLNEADFASTVAKAAEMSGLTVVGSTVSDPNADQQGAIFKISMPSLSHAQAHFVTKSQYIPYTRRGIKLG